MRKKKSKAYVPYIRSHQTERLLILTWVRAGRDLARLTAASFLPGSAPR